MSHHLSSLALAEVQDQVDSIIESSFEPKLQLLDKARNLLSGSSSFIATTVEDVVFVRGRVTVSF